MYVLRALIIDIVSTFTTEVQRFPRFCMIVVLGKVRIIYRVLHFARGYTAKRAIYLSTQNTVSTKTRKHCAVAFQHTYISSCLLLY